MPNYGCSIHRIPCIEHGLHILLIHDLFDNEAMSAVNKVITKIKKILVALPYVLEKAHNDAMGQKIIDFINSVGNLQEIFEAEESLSLHDEDQELYSLLNDRTQFTSLKNSNVTRWSRTFNMLQSVLKNQEVISSCLHSLKRYELMLSTDEIKLAGSLSGI